MVDLSVPLDASTQVYPGDPVPMFEPHATIARDGYNLLRLSLGSQTGTHVDAPYHVRETGARLHEVPLERFVGRGVLVDARGLAPRAPITWDLVEPVAERLDRDVVVLLHTGWSRHYGSPDYFDHPYLDPAACGRLLEAGVRTIGIDAPSPDPSSPEQSSPEQSSPGAGLPVHGLVARAGGVIAENLRNLDQLDWPDPTVLLLPLALRDGDGAPVRAVAVWFEEWR